MSLRSPESSGLTTGTGASLYCSETPLPSSPVALTPHVHTVPSDFNAAAWRPKDSAETAMTSVRAPDPSELTTSSGLVEQYCGTGAHGVAHCSSKPGSVWPSVVHAFEPHAHTVPSPRSASEKSAPAAMALTSVR